MSEHVIDPASTTAAMGICIDSPTDATVGLVSSTAE